MRESALTDTLERAGALIIQGENEPAAEILAAAAADAEEYVARNCPTTDDVQWFSFPTLFERLAYRRVEADPRELRDVGEPLDRLYADLAFAEVCLGDYEAASTALKQAIRWNPMGCGYRLDLAELYRSDGDVQEYLALTFSVFSRASEAAHIVRAFCNFAEWFGATGKLPAQAAALRCARRIDADDTHLTEVIRAVQGTEADPDSISDAQATELLAAEGLPDGANAEIAVCLLMCASDAARAGDRPLATELTIRARDLVGAQAAAALLELINASDENATSEEGGSGA